MSDLRISQLAERSGVPATTLRFYESVGLLPAERTPAGYRIYDEMAVERLAFISSAKRLGLPLEEIAELLQTWADGSCAQVRDDLRPRLAARITEAEQRATELAAFTAMLHQAAEHLDALPERDERCDQECGFLNPRSSRQDAAGSDETQAWRTFPVACTLTGQDMKRRADQWHTLLDGARRQPIPDGLRLTLPAERAGQVAELAAAEQQCCAFFDFRLHLEGPLLHLEVRAPQEAAQLLADLFNPGDNTLVDDNG